MKVVVLAKVLQRAGIEPGLNFRLAGFLSNSLLYSVLFVFTSTVFNSPY